MSKTRCEPFMTGVSNAKFSVFIFLVLCILLLGVVLFCLGCDRRDVLPPDLSSCTRIEIQYYPSTLRYFFPELELRHGVLSPEEIEKIQSIEFFIVNDLNSIKTFAHEISSGFYDGRRQVAYNEIPVGIRCYRDNEQLISFSLFKNLIITKDSCHFKYPRGKGVPNLEVIEPLEMQPFKLRYRCGSNMQILYASGPLYPKKVSLYPEPNEWCDVVMRKRMNISYVSEEEMRAFFKCPSASEGRCHYAMNPHCKPDSSPNTVLLFETKGGWNQHGGPELFTFDHHDPKGGCVLLNDGTVKFIRTKEELQQLRWK